MSESTQSVDFNTDEGSDQLGAAAAEKLTGAFPRKSVKALSRIAWGAKGLAIWRLTYSSC